MINFHWSYGISALETEMDASTLQTVVGFCYTHRAYFDGERHAYSLLKAAMEYGIEDLYKKCQIYLSAASRMVPSISARKLLIVGDSREVNCFDAAMLETLTGNWVGLPEFIGTTSDTRMLASIAYCGDDQIVITGGLKENKPTGVSS